MTGNDQIAALLTTVQDSAQQAKQDAGLSELLTDPATTVAEAAGHPIPTGVSITAARNSDGAVELKAEANSDFDGELDDSLLDEVAGGLMTRTPPPERQMR